MLNLTLEKVEETEKIWSVELRCDFCGNTAPSYEGVGGYHLFNMKAGWKKQGWKFSKYRHEKILDSSYTRVAMCPNCSHGGGNWESTINED